MLVVTCVYSAFLLVISCVDAQLQVRLVDGTAPWNGRLEMLYNGTWRKVCGGRFKKEEAQVTCRMLGFNTSQALAVLDYKYRLNSPHVIVYNLRCTGEETSLDQCNYTRINTHYWVPCDDRIICNTQHTRLRLRDIYHMGPNRGHLQMDIGDGRWETVCVSSDNTAKVVCRQLGLPSHAAKFREILVESSYEFHLRMTYLLSCLGNETSSFECLHKMAPYRHCRIYIICSDYVVNIYTNSTTYPFMEKSNATLKCESNELSGLINYTWPENAGGFPDGSNLIINRVTRKHHGNRVRCEAIYSDGEVISSDTLELQVYYRPVIRITRSDNQGQPLSIYSEVIKGHNVTFWCDVDSNPPPASITWSGKVSSTTGELHIIAAEQTTHEGIYTCTVVTETDDDDKRLPLTASAQITFIVRALYLGILVDKHSYPPLEATNVTLECEIAQSGLSNVDYMWNVDFRQTSLTLFVKFAKAIREDQGQEVQFIASYDYDGLTFLFVRDTLVIHVCFDHTGETSPCFFLAIGSSTTSGVVVVTAAAIVVVCRWSHDFDLVTGSNSKLMTYPTDRWSRDTWGRNHH